MRILKISGGVWLVQVHDFDDNVDLDLIRRVSINCVYALSSVHLVRGSVHVRSMLCDLNA